MRLSRVLIVAAALVAAASCTADDSQVTEGVEPGSPLYQELCGRSERQADTSNIQGGPWKEVVATTFFIGEAADGSNAGIDNFSTAWDDHAVRSFGSGPDLWGPKNPDAPGAFSPRKNRYERSGLCPKGVTLRQNPFYVALPTPDHDRSGRLAAAEPWVEVAASYLPELRQYPQGRFKDGESPFKNLWVQIEYDGRTAFGQLEDVGPSADTGAVVADYEYVWGGRDKPKNEFGLRAGIDLSPAVTDYLGTNGVATVRWRFVPAPQVPDEWKLLVTESPPDWD